MNHTLSEQSLACKHAKEFLIRIDLNDDELIDRLECAAQTLAALNWTKHLPDEGRDKYWNRVTNEMYKHIECCDIVEEDKYKESFLHQTYDVIQSQSTELKEKEKRIEELEEALNGIVRIKDIIVPDDDLVTDENAGEAEAIYKAFSKIESLLNKTN